MTYKNSTFVPNIIFDTLLPEVTLGELKVLMVVVRQTNGWVHARTRKRKTRDRISQSQFVRKTGLSKRVITSSLNSLVTKNLIEATDPQGKPLPDAAARKGRVYIYYSLKPAHITPVASAETVVGPAHKNAHYKTNYQKQNATKAISPAAHISQLIIHRRV